LNYYKKNQVYSQASIFTQTQSIVSFVSTYCTCRVSDGMEYELAREQF